MRHTIAIVESPGHDGRLARALRSNDFQVIEYPDGRSALEGLHIVRPDLMILDLSLADMDGWEVLGCIIEDERTRQLPVIALTTPAMAGDRARLMRAGFDEYVMKPIADDAILLGAIARSLAAASKTAEHRAPLSPRTLTAKPSVPAAPVAATSAAGTSPALGVS